MVIYINLILETIFSWSSYYPNKIKNKDKHRNTPKCKYKHNK